MRNFLFYFANAFASVLLLSGFDHAQTRGETFAITNAKIITVSGASIEKGTVVIRDGLIESVGATANIPADARLIDANGATVYPGFIDALSSQGLPAAAPPRPQGPGAQAQTPTPQSNSNYPNGLQPETSVIDQLKGGDAQFESARNLGFTSALTVGRDGIFNGQSALINLAGDSVSAMIVRNAVAEHISFRSLGQTYPTALLGTFSALRQMFLDAKRYRAVKKMYDANPRGMKRPDADRSLEALIPAVEGAMPVVFNANSEIEIIRALDLAKEFNLQAIIGGGLEAWKVADRLKARDVPVLLSMNFPKRSASASPDADPEPLDILRARAEAPKCAAKLKAAGVRFAFQSGGATNLADFFANAVKATENGLSKDDAIRAMTLSAAEILGVADRLGSIEAGKIANLVVVKGDLLSKEKVVTDVFVDGKRFEQKPAPKSAEPKPSTSDGTAPVATAARLSGVWNISVEIPGESVPITLTISQQGTTMSGNMQSTHFGTADVKNGTVTGDAFRFEATVNAGGQILDVTFNGKANGSQVSGTATTPMGVVPFAGTKLP